MIRKMTCIECPVGCLLEVDVDGGHILKVTGNKCEKGPIYAKQEIESPMRVLTSTVRTEGLEITMLPVRTSGPIPKEKIFEAMAEIKRTVWLKPAKMNDVIISGFLGLDVDLISTRAIT